MASVTEEQILEALRAVLPAEAPSELWFRVG